MSICIYCDTEYRDKAQTVESPCKERVGKRCVPLMRRPWMSMICQFKGHEFCLRNQNQGTSHCRCVCHMGAQLKTGEPTTFGRFLARQGA